MKNHMEEVAKLLGVELDEEFEIIFVPPSSCHATVKLTIDGVKVINTDVYDVFNFKAYLLEHLIKGNYGIKRIPWKPMIRESYWSIKPNGDALEGLWLNEWVDIYHYKIGNCYQTKENALNNRNKWVEFYKSDDVLDI